MRRTWMFTMLRIWLIVQMASLSAVSGQTMTAGQQSTDKPSLQSLTGEIITVNRNAGSLKLKTDAGTGFEVLLDSGGVCLRVPPGETTLAKATAIEFGQLAAGDRL